MPLNWNWRMHFKRNLPVTLLACCFSYQSLAQWGDIYEPGALTSASKLYSPWLLGLFERDLLPRLSANERQSLQGIHLSLPLIGANRHPLDYYADPKKRLVTIPIMSVKFWDDLSIAQSWVDRHKCRKTAVMEYVGFLRYGKLGLAFGGSVPDPMKALGIPQNALDDDWVKTASGNMLKSTIYFLMLHEVGHVLYQHRDYDAILGSEAEGQEIQADAFALDVMERVGVPPIATALFFSAASWFEPFASDFQSDAAYDAYRRHFKTHPMTSERLKSVAGRMERGAARFVRIEPNRANAERAVLQAATDIRKIADIFDYPKLREYQKRRGQTATAQELRTVCN